MYVSTFGRPRLPIFLSLFAARMTVQDNIYKKAFANNVTLCLLFLSFKYKLDHSPKSNWEADMKEHKICMSFDSASLRP
jgi:hypothetical protein